MRKNMSSRADEKKLIKEWIHKAILVLVPVIAFLAMQLLQQLTE
jgi:leucyl-tRNA synthetase